jgi:hypothetical protein
MERLTNVGNNGEIFITDNDETRRFGRKESAYKKLANYEDIGLTPKQVREHIDSSLDAIELCKVMIALDKLKEYEDLEEQGLLLRLPCKIGDTVYIVEYAYNRVVDWELGGFMIFNNKIIAYSPRREYLGVFGQKVFLTKSEAEQALVKLEREENK